MFYYSNLFSTLLKYVTLSSLAYFSLANSINAQGINSSKKQLNQQDDFSFLPVISYAKPVPVSNGYPGGGRSGCLFVSLVPTTKPNSQSLISESFNTHLARPFIWVYVVAPTPSKVNEKPKNRNVKLVDSQGRGKPNFSGSQVVNTETSKFIKFQIPVQPEQSLEINKPYTFSVDCNGNNLPITVKRVTNNIQDIANLSIDKQMIKFAKFGWWAEMINPLFDKSSVCRDLQGANKLFDDLVRNKLLVEQVFNRLVYESNSSPKKDVDIVDIDNMVQEFTRYSSTICK
jgi:hypothetical protein